MEQEKINQLNAAKTTVSYCEATAADTISNTNFAPKVAAIKGKIVAIEGFMQLSNAPISGVRLNVEAIRDSAIEQVLTLASAVFAYAASLTPADQILMAQSKVVRSDLDRGPKENCFNECQRLVTLAQANAANISSYGIDATALSDAQTIVNLFGNAINSPRAAIISRKSAGEQAEATLAEVMHKDLTQVLDSMANIFRFSKSAWWKSYRSSREVIDLGSTFTKLRATVVDEEETPVKGATVSLLQNDLVQYLKKTDDEGKVSIVKIKPGNYDIRIDKKEYLTQTEVDVHFAPGSEKNHPFILKKDTAPGGFKIEEFNIPGNGSLVFPFKLPNPLPVGLEIYLLAKNGDAVLCTTDLPASPCGGGYNLKMGVEYKGPVTGLGLDFSKSNLQITNLSPDNLTVAGGINKD